ncbi:MAG: S8 family serine peptidase [Bdellovibrionales bacterium]|nr:S8 family serine peptidase [Bdellovibrionales bacterium]
MTRMTVRFIGSSLFIFLAACSGGGGGDSAGGGGTAPPTDSITMPTTAYQDKALSVDLSGINSLSSITLHNAPSWLTFNSTSKTLEGIPNDNVNVADLNILVTKTDGTNKTFGPYSITVIGDPLKKYQWHIKNEGQANFATNPGLPNNDVNEAQTIQDGITGNNVKVAVSDSGVEIAHEDLAANVLSGASRNYTLSAPYIGNPTPTSTTDYSVFHGTAVAGIIGAVGWNGKGGRGIAPSCQLAGFRYIGATQNTATSIDQANGSFDIFNYSYGGEPIFPKPENTTYQAQLRYGTTSQRNGKGSLYVKSAGNEFESEWEYDASGGTANCFNVGSGANGVCHYYGNSNLGSIENTSPDIVVVGALSAKGTRSSYSSPGSNIWVSAPGGEFGTDDPAIMTTDLQTCSKGRSSNLISPANSFENSASLNTNCNYTSAMNGTSSAAPATSGVIALILQANPNLTWRDVKYILAATATKTDASAIATQHPGNMNLAGYTYQQGWVQNGAGFWFHNWYGFGRVNADNAVSMAKSYPGTLNPMQITQESNGDWYYTSGTISQSIPDNSAAGTSSSINVRHNLIVESVQMKFATTHQWMTDLGVEVTSPSGTKSILLNINSGIFKNPTLTYDALLLSNAFYGEPSAGNWTLKIVDGATGGTGTLTSWQIDIIGHLDPSPSDTTPPQPVTNLTHASAYNSSSSSPIFSWADSSSGDVLRYEYSIGTSAGGTEKKGWTSVGAMTSSQAEGMSLIPGQTYFVTVRAIDTSENISPVLISTGWLYSTEAEPTLAISSPSVLKMNSSFSSDYIVAYSGASTITLVAEDVTLNQTGGVSCSKSVGGSGITTRTVTISSCTGNGTLTISIGPNTAVNGVGVQTSSLGPSSIITIDNTAPSVSGLTNDGAVTKTKFWTWSCNDSPCTYRHSIDTSAITVPSGGYSSSVTATQSTGTSTYYIHVQAKDAAGNESSVAHVSAVLDNTAPNLTGLSNDSSWAISKIWTWGCDESGCNYRFVVDTNSNTVPSDSFSSTASTSKTSATGTFYIHVQAQDPAGNTSSVAHVSANIDNTVPTQPGTITKANYSTSLTSSPTLSWVTSSDIGAGINRYEVAVGSTSGGAEALNWTSVGNVLGTTVNSLDLSNGTAYFPSIRAVDVAGNISVVRTGTSWTVDNVAPTTVSSLNDGTTTHLVDRSPLLTWSSSSDLGSGISTYQIAIGTTSGGTNVTGWTSVGNVTSHTITGLTLLPGSTYYASIRVVDSATNISSIANGDGWLVHPCSPTGSIVFLALTNTEQSFQVPSGCDEILVKSWGAGGGNGGTGSSTQGASGAGGAFASGEIPVTQNETLTIVVGEKGSDGVGVISGVGSGGGGGGGGFTAVYRSSLPLLIASGGGGGGGGARNPSYSPLPGNPGGIIAASCTSEFNCSLMLGGIGGGSGSLSAGGT